MPSRAHRYRALRALAVGLGALAISAPGLACGSDDPETGGTATPVEEATAPSDEAAAAPGSVDTFDFGFGPEETTVEAGETVTWENSGETLHNVKGPGFFSDGLDAGDTYRHKFTKPGTYEYLCTLHPDQMQGTIVVK